MPFKQSWNLFIDGKAGKLIHCVLILIILGSEVSVQMEQEDLENQISTSDKDLPFVLDSEPGKEWIQLKEVGKNENPGKWIRNTFETFIYVKQSIMLLNLYSPKSCFRILISN